MFTGIVEETGKVQAIQRGKASSALTIQGKLIFSDLKTGDSVAVNGVCLTAASCAHNTFQADVMHETLNRSSLGSLITGSRVNLERAVPADGRFGGHIVTGHIDGTGCIEAIQKDDCAVLYTIKAPRRIMRYIVEKGSVAVDGISLTVCEVREDRFVVSVIPHTAKSTILSERSIGSMVNLENDIIGKYIEKMVACGLGAQGAEARMAEGAHEGRRMKGADAMSKEFLMKYGFGG